MVITGPVRRGLSENTSGRVRPARTEVDEITRRDEERHDHDPTAREDPGCPHRRPVLPAPDALAARVTCGGDEGNRTESRACGGPALGIPRPTVRSEAGSGPAAAASGRASATAASG